MSTSLHDSGSFPASAVVEPPSGYPSYAVPKPALPFVDTLFLWLERAMLVMLVTTLPLEEMLPSVAGRSVPTVLFIITAAYLFLTRPRSLIRTAQHRIFVAGGVFVVVSAGFEAVHPSPDYSFLTSTAQMLLGAICMAALCRNRISLSVVFGAQVVGGLMVTLMFVTSSYNLLLGVDAKGVGFEEASAIREQVYGDNDLLININRLAFMAAQATVIAFAMGIVKQKLLRAPLVFAMSAASLLGTFLTFSRGGVLAAVAGSAVVALAANRNRSRMFLTAVALCIATIVFVPEVVIQRMVFKPQVTARGNLEGRSMVYQNILSSLPEYIVSGVGAGQYEAEWAATHGMTSINKSGNTVVLGAHNVPLQVAVYWGIPGLLMLLILYISVFRSIPRSKGGDWLQLGVVGTAVTLLVLSLVTHSLYGKVFSVQLGIIAGAGCWRDHIWPGLPKRTRP